MKSKELELQIKELERKKEKLEKERIISLVDEDKAFNCRKCKTVVIKEDASPAEIEKKLCWNCLRRKKSEEQKKEMLSKIKYGRLVDINIDTGWSTLITSITAKQGRMYELKAVEDEGDAWFSIDREWKENIQVEEEEIKPWQKKRKEKPLVHFFF